MAAIGVSLVNAIWIGSPNFSIAGGRRILGMVLHSSEGTLAAMTSVFQTPNAASAHYAIGTDGRRYQYVKDEHVAYHVAAWGNDPRLNRNRPSWLPTYNGLYSAVNACTLGVELEGFAASGFTAAQYDELGRLIAEKSAEHGFPLTLLPEVGADARVVTHGWLQTDRSDPGPLFQWEELRRALGGADVTPEQQRILDAAARHGLDDAGIDNLVGVNTELGKQVNSLSWLLSVSQGETAARDAVIAQLQAQPSTGDVNVERVEVQLSGGKVQVLSR